MQERNIGLDFSRPLSETRDSLLIANVGALAVGSLTLSEAVIDNSGCTSMAMASTAEVASKLRHEYCHSFGFSNDSCWITWHGSRLLWLPVDFRPSYSAVSGSTIAIGCGSGRVILMRFSAEKLPEF
jgi:hypothetical protein